MSLFKDEKGQGLTEYMTLLVLIALVSVGAAQSLGKNLKGKIQKARERIDSGITFKDVK